MDVQSLQDGQRRVLRTAFIINAFAFLWMLAAALYSHSSSLLSGGLDNFGDAVTYALSLAVVGASHRSKRRVALFKGLLIFAAALAVAAQIGWRLLHPTVPLFDAMGAAALLNLAANGICLYLLMPYRHGDINMSSAWECSRNDVFEEGGRHFGRRRDMAVSCRVARSCHRGGIALPVPAIRMASAASRMAISSGFDLDGHLLLKM